MDQAGLLLRQQLLAYFGPERCRVVTFGDQCKDANEHLQRYGVEMFTYDMLSGRYEPFEANRKTLIQATKDGAFGYPAPVKSKRRKKTVECQVKNLFYSIVTSRNPFWPIVLALSLYH